MPYPIQWILSLVFIIQMYVMMLILAIIFTPFAILNRRFAFNAVHTYCAWVRWSARVMVGLKSEIRGTPPTGEVLICAKHQSFFDIILIVAAVPRPRFVMKAELKWAPILGYYAFRIGCIPVNRGRKAKAIDQMVAGVEARKDMPGQLIIYPQGTRVAAGAYIPYKIGSGILYEGLGQECIPVAANVGVFWPRHGIYRKRGTAIVEFLPGIPAGMSARDFMAELEEVVETNSNRLMAEAGFDVET